MKKNTEDSHLVRLIPIVSEKELLDEKPDYVLICHGTSASFSKTQKFFERGFALSTQYSKGLKMIFKSDFFRRYVAIAPLPLALERSWECQIMAMQKFQRPILDLGCGEGIFVWNLMDEKIDVAIDPNARELERAKKLNLYEELIECPGHNIPKSDKYFQTIFSNSVFEHISDIEATLKEAHRLLTDNGTIYLTLPTDQFNRYTIGNQILIQLGLEVLAKKFRKFFNNFWAHYHDYSAANWRILFDKSGFKVRESFEYGSKRQVMFNDFASPFCFPAMIVKKFSNRWFLIPPVRDFLSRIIHLPLFSRFVST